MPGQPLPPLALRDLSGGMVSYASDALLPLNACHKAVNLHFGVLGKATQRDGTAKLGATVSGTDDCTGIFGFVNSSGRVNSLLAGFGDEVFAYDGASWSSLRSGLDGSKVRFTAFLDTVFMVGGGLATQTSNGTAAFSAGPLVNGAPSGKFVETFKQRVYVAGNASNPDRLYFSTIASSSGSLSWDTTTQWLDVNPSDGMNVTALKKISNLLLVFKERAMYRWNGSATDAEIVVDVGTPSQESVVQAKGLVYFFSDSPLGIFVTDGGYPQEISRPVHDWLMAIPASAYPDVASAADSDHVYVSVGDVEKDGRTYRNVHLTYSVSSKDWCIYSFADRFLAMGRRVDASGNVTLVGGTDGGEVHVLFSGNDDDGTPITWEYETKELEFDSRSTVKAVSEAVTYVQNGAGAGFLASAEGGPFKTLGQVKGPVTFFDGIDVRGRWMRLKLSGSNRGAPAVIEGLEVLTAHTLGPVRD